MQTTPIKYRNNSTGSINLTLMPPSTAGVYSILAVVNEPKDDKTWQLAGRLDVLSRTPKTYSVTLVPLVEDQDIDEGNVRTKLNNIWNQYGISWEVDVDNEFYVDVQGDDGAEHKQYVNEILDGDWTKSDNWLSEYKPVQKAINSTYNTYASSQNTYDNTRMYVFVLPEDKAPYNNQIGDMFSVTRLSGVLNFKLGGTVKPLVELIPISEAISGPLGKQWGYLFVNEFGSDDSHYRTLSHELGHVSETRILGACEPKCVSRTNPDERSDIGSKTELQHTFAGDNPDHIITKSSTNNLMDYSNGTDLVRFQWEAIHNPALIGKVFQDDEDGSLYGGNCLFTEWIEKIRHSSQNNSILELNTKLIEGVKNIKLSDNSLISDIRIYSPNGYNKLLNSNPRISEMERTGKTMTYIQFGDQVSSFQNNPVYELEIITNPSDKEKVLKYLFDKEHWDSNVRLHFIDKMVEGREAAIDFLNCLPDEYYSDISVLHRMDILNTLNQAKNIKERWFGGVDEESVAIQVIKTTPQDQIGGLFARLEENNLIIDLYKKIHDVFGMDNETRFMSELLLLYYSQSQLYLHACANSTAKYVPWVKESTHYYDYMFNTYSESTYGYLKPYLSVVPEEGDLVIFDEYNYFTGIWNKETNEFEPMVVSPLTCLSVYFYSSVDFIGVENMALPMPAIFFKWMNEEVVERQTEAMAELTLKIAAVAIPGYQLVAGTKSAVSVIIGLASFLHASGDFFMELSGVTCDKLSQTQNGEQFCLLWSNLGLAISSASILEDVVGGRLPLFYILCFTWDNMLNDPDLSLEQTLGEDEYSNLNNKINKIKLIINE